MREASCCQQSSRSLPLKKNNARNCYQGLKKYSLNSDDFLLVGSIIWPFEAWGAFPLRSFLILCTSSQFSFRFFFFCLFDTVECEKEGNVGFARNKKGSTTQEKILMRLPFCMFYDKKKKRFRNVVTRLLIVFLLLFFLHDSSWCSVCKVANIFRLSYEWLRVCSSDCKVKNRKKKTHSSSFRRTVPQEGIHFSFFCWSLFASFENWDIWYVKKKITVRERQPFRVCRPSDLMSEKVREEKQWKRKVKPYKIVKCWVSKNQWILSLVQ